MRVDEVFKQAASQGTAPVSFEMFPPKGELTLDTAREVAANLCKLSPSFVSVTCSAGGSGNGATTAPIAHMITSEFDTPSVAHLTCVGRSHARISPPKSTSIAPPALKTSWPCAAIFPLARLRTTSPPLTTPTPVTSSPSSVDAGLLRGSRGLPRGPHCLRGSQPLDRAPQAKARRRRELLCDTALL